MNGQAKFPRGQGRPISVKRARAEQMRWKRNPKHSGMTESFPVDVSLIMQALKEYPEATGIKFCNGVNEGEYTPVMAAVNEEGIPLVAFNSTDNISLEEFASCRSGWKERFRDNGEVVQFFFMGEEALLRNIEDFGVTKYEASFVEKANSDETAILFGYSSGFEKDPGDEDPETALNFPRMCPPFCEEE